jgi:predicted nicotinamide N-methyase
LIFSRLFPLQLADRIDRGTIDCKGKTCLELGAGAGLPGLVAALTGASASVISDYGTEVDPSLVKAIEMNLEAIAPFVGSDYTIPEVSITTTVYINDEKPENSNNSNSNSNSTGTTKGATVDISVGQTADGRPPSDSSSVPPVLAGVGYVWGYPIDPLTNSIGGGKFDLVFLADLIFNR